jgi:ABC-type nitrate/sulfonate/bicarbonate transport system substrate-binding protein
MLGLYRLVVADLGSPSYFVATAAATLGFFKEEGIEMAPVIGSEDAEQNTKGLNEGTAHFFGGPAYGPLKTFPEFEGVKILCALAQHSYWFMGIRKDLDVEKGDLNALKGLRISSSQSSPGQGLRQMLADAGLDLERDNIKIVKAPSAGKHQKFRGSDGVIALQQGISDAFWGNGMRLEIGVRSGLAKLHIDLRRGDGPPGARFYNFPALAASEAFINAHPDLAAGAVRAIVKTQKALKLDPSLATEVGRKVFPEEEADIIATLVTRDAPFYDANVSQEAIEGLNKFCVARGLMSKPVPYEKLVATQFSSLWGG